MAKRDMLINYVPGEECRIAIVEDGSLEEFYQERADAGSHVGNIYKGKVQNVEASIQAAFVDFGLERNGFLHISDLHPMYFPGKDREEAERVGMRTPRRERPPIQRCLRRGQDILVQVLKEGIGTKGPTLTSYLSIPGRFLVMMPFMQKLGVSRKVEDDERRRAMRKILDELSPPDDFGFIIRTAGMDRTKTELKRDLAYLQRLWKAIDRRNRDTKIGELYTESDLIIRTIRDVYSNDIDRIIVDDRDAAERAADFLAVASPRAGANVLHYHDPVPIFERYGIEQQIESIGAAEVALPSGGSLVIESTEALVAIDVNSGKMRDNRDAETTAYRTNIEACDEICRQLRLRDLGGVVVNDLIDMRDPKHRRAIEARFRDNLKNDRARTRVLPLSQFGILEMTRQRMRPSLHSAQSSGCPHCAGTGKIKSPQLVVLDVIRRLAAVLYREDVAEVELVVSPDVAFQVLNRRRAQLVRLEQRYGKVVMVRVRQGGRLDAVDIEARDERGGRIDLEAAARWGEPNLEPVQKAASGRGRIGDEGEDEDVDATDEPQVDEQTDQAAEQPSETGHEANGAGKIGGRRRRRRRKTGGSSGDTATGGSQSVATSSTDATQQAGVSGAMDDGGVGGVRGGRRRRRRKKSDVGRIVADGNGSGSADVDKPIRVTEAESATNEEPRPTEDAGAEKPRRRRSRRRRGKSRSSEGGSTGPSDAGAAGKDSDAGAAKPSEDRSTPAIDAKVVTAEGMNGVPGSVTKKRRRRRRSRSGGGAGGEVVGNTAGGSVGAAAVKVNSAGYRNPRLESPSEGSGD